jgi:hypothetical protein
MLWAGHIYVRHRVSVVLRKVVAFFRGGSSDFNSAEKRIISFMSEALPAAERDILAKQLTQIRLVQRPSAGRIVVAYYDERSNFPKLPYPGYEHCLANVSYRSKGKTKTTSLVLHDGHLMTIERNVPKEAADIESLVKVVLHPKGFTNVTRELDAEEHGPASD